MKIFTIVALIMRVSLSLRGTETQHTGVQQLISNPEGYGFVMGNDCGTVLNATRSKGGLSLSVQLDEKFSIRGKLAGSNLLKGRLVDQAFELLLNKDGSGKGALQDGTPIFLIKGKKTTDSEAISYVRAQGFMSEAMRLVRENKFPGHDAIGYYSYREKGFMMNTYVFKTGFRHYSYGLQPKIRSVFARKSKGRWSVWEDNSAFE